MVLKIDLALWQKGFIGLEKALVDFCL